jgi:hypothetical protein
VGQQQSVRRLDIASYFKTRSWINSDFEASMVILLYMKLSKLI